MTNSGSMTIPDSLKPFTITDTRTHNNYPDIQITQDILNPYLVRDYVRSWQNSGQLAVPHHPCTYLKNKPMLDLAMSKEVIDALRRFWNDPLVTPLLHLTLPNWFSTERNWHQDCYLNPPYVGDDYAAVWMALEDIHPDSGPFQYLPDTHTLPPLTLNAPAFQHIDRNNSDWPKHTEATLTPIIDNLIQTNQLPQPVTYIPQKYDLLVWNARTYHRGSIPKDPTRQRRALIAHYSKSQVRSDMAFGKQNYDFMQHTGQYFDPNARNYYITPNFPSRCCQHHDLITHPNPQITEYHWLLCRNCLSVVSTLPFNPNLYTDTYINHHRCSGIDLVKDAENNWRNLIPDPDTHKPNRYYPDREYRILDIGCNDGSVANYLSNSYDTYAFDINPAAAPDYKNLQLTTAPTYSHKLFPSMDAILCREVLEHVPDWRDLIDEISLTLKPGGILDLQTPLPINFASPLVYQPAHLQLLHPNLLTDYLKSAGFTITFAETWATGQHYVCRKNLE